MGTGGKQVPWSRVMTREEGLSVGSVNRCRPCAYSDRSPRVSGVSLQCSKLRI